MTLTTFKQIYQDLWQNGERTSPRGQLTVELINYAYTLSPYDRFAAFPSRNLSIPYIKKELLWYLGGDLSDLSICQHARIWEKCVTDGKLNSNYGYYVFKRRGIDYVVDCLRHDPDSRRAVITILDHTHQRVGINDVPCTVSIGFRIRGGQVLCTVHMRSQDAVYGMGNDVPFFSIVHEMVCVYLGLPMGPLTVFIESFHAYERHFKLLEALCVEDQSCVTCPPITSPQEIDILRAGDFSPWYDFSRWLYASR